jgi:hypothetical protein
MSLSARVRRHAWLIGVFVIVVIAASSMFRAGPGKRAEVDPAQQAREELARAGAIKLGNWRYQEVCPSGHKTEIVMGKMHLYVDMRLVALLELETFQEVPDDCPTKPIFAQAMSFDHIFGTKEYDAMIEGRGLPLNHMDLRRIVAERYREPEEIPENPDLRTIVDGVGYVDDISRQSHLSSPTSRGYLLHYLSPLGAAPSTIAMICHGDVQTNRWRYCSTTYRYSDVLIEYEFRQETNFPHYKGPQIPVNEPDGFLAVDANVRSWMAEMLQEPEVVQ